MGKFGAGVVLLGHAAGCDGGLFGGVGDPAVKTCRGQLGNDIEGIFSVGQSRK